MSEWISPECGRNMKGHSPATRLHPSLLAISIASGADRALAASSVQPDLLDADINRVPDDLGTLLSRHRDQHAFWCRLDIPKVLVHTLPINFGFSSSDR